MTDSAQSVASDSAIAIDYKNPEASIAEAVQRFSNWGRWGVDDVHGTLNFIDDAKRIEAARLVRRGAAFSLTQRFDAEGPQKGWRRRTNPIHTMLDTGLDAEFGDQGFRTASAAPTMSSPCRCKHRPSGTASVTFSTTGRPGTAAVRVRW